MLGIGYTTLLLWVGFLPTTILNFLNSCLGAFAFFGPGSHGIYSKIIQPAAHGKLFFAGEATSTCHAYVSSSSLQFFERTPDPNVINRWIAGALDSAWRAVDQYIALNLDKDVREKFWELWGPTEFWDEASNKDLVELNRKLMARHLVISLQKDGVKFE